MKFRSKYKFDVAPRGYRPKFGDIRKRMKFAILKKIPQEHVWIFLEKYYREEQWTAFLRRPGAAMKDGWEIIKIATKEQAMIDNLISDNKG